MKNYLVDNDTRVWKCSCGRMFFWIFTEIIVLSNDDIVEAVECKNCQKRYCRKIK